MDFKEINKIVKGQGFVFEMECCDFCGKHGVVAMAESATIMGAIDARDEGATYLRICETCVAKMGLAFALLKPKGPETPIEQPGGTTDGSSQAGK